MKNGGKNDTQGVAHHVRKSHETAWYFECNVESCFVSRFVPARETTPCVCCFELCHPSISDVPIHPAKMR